MDPSIAAAWIGAGVGGGVALVGLAGTVASSIVNSNNTRRATERAVEAGTEVNRAALLAAREERLWERRAAAYEEALTVLLHRQAKRHYELRPYLLNDESEEKLQAFFDTYKLSGEFETDGSLAAYASDAVMDAYKFTRGAHLRVRVQCVRIEVLRKQIQTPQASAGQGAPDVDEFLKAQQQLDDAVEAADAADDALIEAIRDGIRSRPEVALQRVIALPAVRRKLWYGYRE
jgi:hypothetical protein